MDDVPVGTLHCNVPANPYCNIHVHENDVTQTHSNKKTKNHFMSEISPKPGTLSMIIRSYKLACTTTINKKYLVFS